MREEGETVPSVVSLLLTPIVTLAVGWMLSLTVNVAVPPASVVLSAEPEDPVPATVVTAPEVVVLLDVLLFLAQELTVRLKRDMRIMYKTLFILFLYK